MRGHIHKRCHTCKDGRVTTNWYTIIDLPRSTDGRRHQRWYGGYRTRREAEAVLAQLLADLNTGRYVRPTAMSFGAWLSERWLPSLAGKLKPTTIGMYERNVELQVSPRLGQVPLQALTPGHLNALYQEMLRTGNHVRPGGLKSSTVRSIATMIHTALSSAVDAGVLSANPAERARPPRRGPARIERSQCWDPLQLRLFLNSIEMDRLGAAYFLAAMTGMRRCEVLGLHWADIDFEAAEITIRHSLVALADGRQVFTTPKSGRIHRVSIDEITVNHLRRHQDRVALEERAWGTGYEASDLVFRREDGSAVHAGTFSRHFTKLVREAGLPIIRLHDLRHTHASIALGVGVPIKVVSDRLGHADPAFTLMLYTHVLPGQQAEAARLIANTVTEAVEPRPSSQ